ncbi:hypothetical protein D3OALGA1CA_2143 [Olavius algarvensis associated proteobacterium Delta 3]|nr:hypothetical protein D3OALGA1CA_2143 [Olavius algarvensis associated proteobacterium Delta 3]
MTVPKLLSYIGSGLLCKYVFTIKPRWRKGSGSKSLKRIFRAASAGKRSAGKSSDLPGRPDLTLSPWIWKDTGRDSGKPTVPLRPLRLCDHRFHMSANGTYLGQPL